jgi:hypothetical protein
VTSNRSLFCSERGVAQKEQRPFFCRSTVRPTCRFSCRRNSFSFKPIGSRSAIFYGRFTRPQGTALGNRSQHLFLYERTKQNQPALIGGLGMGLIAATAPRVLATEQSVQQAPPPSEESDVAKAANIRNPSSKGQSQPWPGLASKMDPPPDHGEKSYKGSGRLMGRRALITGGDSGVGRAAVMHLHGRAPT